MIHYFQIDELKALADSDYLIQCATDDQNGLSVQEVFEVNRQIAEDYVKSRAGVKYDVTQWDVDADSDGISDNINGILKACAMKICIFNIANRRNDQIPQNIERMYAEAMDALEKMDMGMLILATNAASIQRTMGGNMVKGNLGELTEGDDKDPLPWAGFQ